MRRNASIWRSTGPNTASSGTMVARCTQGARRMAKAPSPISHSAGEAATNLRRVATVYGHLAEELSLA